MHAWAKLVAFTKGESFFRWAVLILLLLILSDISDTKNLADAARVNAARALNQAQAAASNSMDAYDAAADCRRR